MRRFRIVEPRDPDNNNWEPVDVIVTDSQILEWYWATWWKKAKVFYQEHPNCQNSVSMESCIEDWIVINWAEEIK